jgi:hypothetical protein
MNFPPLKEERSLINFTLRSSAGYSAHTLARGKSVDLYGCQTWSLTLREEHRLRVRFQVLTATSMKMTVFWDVAPCSLVQAGRRLRGTYCQTTWCNIPEDSHLHRSRVSENRVLTRIFGPRREKVTGRRKKLHNEELHGLYTSLNIIRAIKSRRMGSWGM